MASEIAGQHSTLLAETKKVERQRGSAIMQDPALADWVRAFRQKFIVSGFLMPMYSINGRFSTAKRRVSQFGDYILPWEMEGRVFRENPMAWIRAEDTWFWSYLTDGQDIIASNTAVPDQYIFTGIPAKLVWQEIITISKNLKLFGEVGGGILLAPQDLDDDYLAQDDDETRLEERKEGFSESNKSPDMPRWITKFHPYTRKDTNLPFEVRPPWYHLANHAFYNAPINRLPVFCTVLNLKGQVEQIRFPTSDLSSQAREYLGKEFFRLPKLIENYTESFSIRKKQKDLGLWLWHNVGHPKSKKTLSYEQIASFTGLPRSTVQESISRFSQRLEKEMDGILLGQILKAAAAMGLGPNEIYKVLVGKGFVPARERDIDSFDDPDKLI